MKVEITSDLNLSPQEESLLDMHSFLNIMNVINASLYFLGDDIGDEKILEPSLHHVQKIAESLADTDEALASAHAIEKTKSIIRDNLSAVIAANPDLSDSPVFIKARGNFESIFDVLDVRAREILARYSQDEQWIEFSIDQLTTNFVNVFTAIEMNAQGRYHIVYNIAAKNDNDYLVNMQINSQNNKTVHIPAVFQDVMRDLVANARKYSPIGSTITFGLNDDSNMIRFIVADNGHGIPEDQVEQVVGYGNRASNVIGKPTMGGGFGLTKAYYVTRQLNGRFWIDSEIDTGTKIEIEFPVTASSASAS